VALSFGVAAFVAPTAEPFDVARKGMPALLSREVEVVGEVCRVGVALRENEWACITPWQTLAV
jgi:hypothetical protein